MNKRAKISTGMSDRPVKDTIAESGSGIAENSGRMVEVPDTEEEVVKRSLRRDRLDELKDQLEEEIDLPQRGAP